MKTHRLILKYLNCRKFAFINANTFKFWSHIPPIKLYWLISTYLNGGKFAFVIFVKRLLRLISRKFNMPIVTNILYVPSTPYLYLYKELTSALKNIWTESRINMCFIELSLVNDAAKRHYQRHQSQYYPVSNTKICNMS